MQPLQNPLFCCFTGKCEEPGEGSGANCALGWEEESKKNRQRHNRAEGTKEYGNIELHPNVKSGFKPFCCLQGAGEVNST